MIEKILEGLGYYKASEYEAKLEALKKQAEKVTLSLSIERAKSKGRPVIDVALKDPSPVDTEARKLYVARAAQFHKEVLYPKLIHLIATVREQFGQVDRNTFGHSQADFDMYLKGTENAFWLINDWGEECINEQIANQTGEGAAEAKEELKAELNKK